MADASDLLVDRFECRFLGIVQPSAPLAPTFMLPLLWLEKLPRLSSVSFVSTTGAVLTSMIGVSLEQIPQGHIPAFSPAPTVHEARLAGANVVFDTMAMCPSSPYPPS
ncbi:uncharacterized protein N7498_004353 [Penicillium cinerascens]|uniref:Uncharacterized protein n=1 Tax=Penicillium cinerascens TaxID=70096 RepID=A0A9W9N3X4_9EURO|nr:uncharacterized protein N7498_004353 [Penicillium cinerascens]KAJ5212707.1 hypothetical protein N7498_004353 [Penicillium cinerascens]